MATKKQSSPVLKALEAAGLDGVELIAEVARLEVKPGDVIVLKSEGRIRPEFEVYLSKQMSRYFPNNRTIVISGGIELQVLSEAAPAKIGVPADGVE